MTKLSFKHVRTKTHRYRDLQQSISRKNWKKCSKKIKRSSTIIGGAGAKVVAGKEDSICELPSLQGLLGFLGLGLCLISHKLPM